MDKRRLDDESPALTVQAHGDTMVHTTRISATKSAPRRIVGLALTIEIHSNWSRPGTHLSTWINGASMMSRRHTHRSAFCDSIDHAMPIFTTKSAPRQIVRLALTIEIHSNWSRSRAHLST
ncbi:hypothetical protein [Burkholderia multivorans]|uniref:hypothetical protein n=1 Tax=Burkholderia multivorans TaxID=87883 RepID=UPI000D004A55|nr:hypothetical protein [Burkholderia multivorans]MBU9515099.1 hypothetical protein [Burkholderia multivorans]MBU9526305.1 hypothetical protein [Burkholderia multivorans]MBU9635819.1 hypothetical protein [Burkholderia multivorans]PRF03830.1 hypothetical protein C6Q07_19130 [Burkholderia multivorans]